MENINQIFLIGMMGSGKSSTGKALADSLNWTFYDIDNELEKDHNLSISDMFVNGEPQFREQETKKLKEIALKEVIRYELPNLLALNFIIKGSLRGGGSDSLLHDAQGKTHGQLLLLLELDAPESFHQYLYSFNNKPLREHD